MKPEPICGYLDDPRLWDQAETAHTQARAQEVEDMADNLLADCITVEGAEAVNMDNDLAEGLLLARLMSAVANWTGSTTSACEQIRKLDNLLADALQDVAERKVL